MEADRELPSAETVRSAHHSAASPRAHGAPHCEGEGLAEAAAWALTGLTRGAHAHRKTYGSPQETSLTTETGCKLEYTAVSLCSPQAKDHPD
eukprot:13075810-Alexandrium_andersonii.AAC.1